MDIKVQRIATKLNEYFSSLISMEDYKKAKPSANEEEINVAFLSRSLAAFAIVIKTNCDFQEAANSVTDGFQDNGIDAIYIDKADKNIYLIQAKWISDGKASISQGDTLKFTSGIEHIVELQFDDFNEKIKNREEEITKALSNVEYRLTALVIMTTINDIAIECKDVLNKKKNSFNEGNIELFDYSSILLTQIYKRMIEDVSDKEITLDNLILNNWGIIEYDDSAQGYYGIVSAEIIADWWQKFGIRLLHKNIRNFKGDTEVNKGMINVLSVSPELFCFYNNGIKIIAQNIQKALVNSNNKKSGSFILQDASIVNGAQTYGSIGTAYIDNSSQTSKANVFVEIISLNGMVEEIGKNITKLSNTQNRIESKDFVAMDGLQEKIKQDLLLDSIEYIYKAGEDEPSMEKHCTLDEVTTAIGCYLEDITISANMKRSYGSTFEQIDKPPYTMIFNTSLSTFKIWNCVTVQRVFEKVISEYQKKDQDNRLIAIHGNRFLLHGLYQIYKKQMSFEQKYLAESDFPESKMKEYIKTLIELLVKAKIKLYPDSYAANIFKNAKRCRELESEIDYSTIV